MAKVEAGSKAKGKAAKSAAKEAPAKKPVTDNFASAPPPKKSNLPATAAQSRAVVGTEDFAPGQGLENVGGKDILIPRITLLQGLSPQVTKGKPEYNEDAEIGDFCDTGTGDIYRGELLFVPCFFARIYLVWGAQRGKGLIANLGVDDSQFLTAEEEVDAKGGRRMVLPDGNTIVETPTWYVLNLEANGRKSFISLPNTMAKASRSLMTRITSERIEGPNGEFTPPIYYRTWKAKPVMQTNEKGTWANWMWEPGEVITEFDTSKQLLAAAKEFYSQAKDGLVKADLSSMNNEDKPDDKHGEM